MRWLATARAQRRRVEGRDDPATWAAVGDAWAALGIPYETARARWREAEARLGSGAGRAGRADARTPLIEAAEMAMALGAMPLLRELRELAGRALITLPVEVEGQLAGLDDAPGRPGDSVAVGPGVPLDGEDGLDAIGPHAGRGRALGRTGSARYVRARAVASARSWPRSHEAGPTARSASGCSSARRPWACTWATSCPSSGSPGGSRPRRSRSGSVSPSASRTRARPSGQRARPGGRSPGLE